MDYSVRQQNDDIFIKIGFVCFIVFIMDCSISGGGHWLMFGALSFRMVLGLIIILLSLPKTIKKFQILLKNPMIISLTMFVLYLMVSAIVGCKRGNRYDVLISDLKGFSWLFIVPIAIVLIDNQDKLVIVMKSIILASVIRSLIILSFNISLVFFDPSYSDLQKYIQNIQFGAIDAIGGGIYRFFFPSTLSNIGSCIFLVYFQMKRRKINWIFVVTTALLYFVILISYTRSTYFSAFLAFMMALFGYTFFFSKKINLLFRFHSLALFFAVIFVFSFQITAGNNYLTFGLLRTFPSISL